MTNVARVWYPNAIYHITARGNRRNDIFKDEEDFQVYLTIIEGSLEYFKNEFEILCYCLMDNHVHLLLQSKLASLATTPEGHEHCAKASLSEFKLIYLK